MVDRGMDATAEHPAYVFEAVDLDVYPGPNTSGAEADVVEMPVRVERAASGSLSGSTLTISSGNAVEEVHEETLIAFNDGAYYGKITDHAGVTVDTDAPDGSYSLTFYDYGFTRLPERLEGAVVELAAMLCFAALGDGDRFQTARSNAQDERSAYLMPYFDINDLG